ncbi:MAG: ribonuclease HII [Spirochaetota bacterium]
MLICGVDEAGRGPLAGPVSAAAVILPRGYPVEELRDSKRLTAGRREHLFDAITADALAWGIGWASHVEIDTINILRASHLAMRRAVAALTVRPEGAIVDGSVLPELGVPAEAIVKADATVPAVMAASILAKVARDRWMEAYARIDPRYGFNAHKGYPTPRHREVLAALGPSAIHRRSFDATCSRDGKSRRPAHGCARR